MKSYRSLLSVLLCLCFAAPAWAVVGIKEVLIREKSPNVNIRVVINNPGGPVHKGPVLITLFARENAKTKWEKIKTWNDIHEVLPGNEVARDFFNQDSARLAKLAKMPGFQARAVVSGPGLHTIERTSSAGQPSKDH